MQQLGRNLGEVTTPNKLSGKRSDLEVWRHILQLFLDANILNIKGEPEVGLREQSAQIERLLELQKQAVEFRKVSLTQGLRCYSTDKLRGGR